MKLLLTGFEPFGGSAVNPSEQAVHTLAADPPAGIELSTAILPVDRIAGPEALLKAVAENEPDVVICLGEATGRAVISIERLAVNLLDFRIPDNKGEQVVDQPIRADGPAAYFATLPVRKLQEALTAAGTPCELSLTAGAYLCNQVMYTLLDYAARERPGILGGFIHLPCLPQQASARAEKPPSMGLETILCALRTAISALL